jgi:hypothetical protein
MGLNWFTPLTRPKNVYPDTKFQNIQLARSSLGKVVKFIDHLRI